MWECYNFFYKFNKILYSIKINFYCLCFYCIIPRVLQSLQTIGVNLKIIANKGVRADGFSLHSNQRTSGFSLAPLCCLGEERTPIYQNFELLIYLVSFD